MNDLYTYDMYAQFQGWSHVLMKSSAHEIVALRIKRSATKISPLKMMMMVMMMMITPSLSLGSSYHDDITIIRFRTIIVVAKFLVTIYFSLSGNFSSLAMSKSKCKLARKLRSFASFKILPCHRLNFWQVLSVELLAKVNI